ncbi:MAG TPA: carboxypeptidase-like regulatory domain-containing protein [Pyrinomonadaceae bacterium]
MTARSLAGVVRAPNGEALADVLVERVSADWKNRIDATFTDPEGRFVLSTLTDERYFLKVSKSGFCTLRVKVRVKKKAKSLMELALPLGI